MTTLRFIVGSGRSGTTWIQDALAATNGLRPVFEPLHPYVSEIGRRYAHRALAVDDSHPDLARFLIRTSAGRGPRLWTQYRQQWRWLIPPVSQFSTRQDAGRFRRHWGKFVKEFPRMTRDGLRGEPIVKCIRANLMLPWVKHQLDCRIVLVMRHPGAVVESELRTGWNAAFALDRFRKDERLDSLTQGRYRKLLAREMRPIEALTLRWVIENQWVAETAESLGIPVFYYEEFRSSDRTAWARLCEALDVPRVPQVSVLTKPSQQSGTARTEVPIDLSPTPRWMRLLTAEQKNRVHAILDEVGFGTYVMDAPHPRAEPWSAPIAADPGRH